MTLCFPISPGFRACPSHPRYPGLQESSGFIIFFFPGQLALACLSIASTLAAIFMVVSSSASSISYLAWQSRL
ncbi:hypothetical protein GRZ57_00420 [Sphaerochaeta halotolerans]|nr:hypothetical protein [Sphaerochaeta halotolerans]